MSLILTLDGLRCCCVSRHHWSLLRRLSLVRRLSLQWRLTHILGPVSHRLMRVKRPARTRYSSVLYVAAVSSQAFPVAVVCIWISLHSTSPRHPLNQSSQHVYLDTLSTSLHSTSPRHPLNQSSQHVTWTPSQPVFTARHLDTL